MADTSTFNGAAIPSEVKALFDDIRKEAGQNPPSYTKAAEALTIFTGGEATITHELVAAQVAMANDDPDTLKFTMNLFLNNGLQPDNEDYIDTKNFDVTPLTRLSELSDAELCSYLQQTYRGEDFIGDLTGAAKTLGYTTSSNAMNADTPGAEAENTKEPSDATNHGSEGTEPHTGNANNDADSGEEQSEESNPNADLERRLLAAQVRQAEAEAENAERTGQLAPEASRAVSQTMQLMTAAGEISPDRAGEYLANANVLLEQDRNITIGADSSGWSMLSMLNVFKADGDIVVPADMFNSTRNMMIKEIRENPEEAIAHIPDSVMSADDKNSFIQIINGWQSSNSDKSNNEFTAYMQTIAAARGVDFQGQLNRMAANMSVGAIIEVIGGSGFIGQILSFLEPLIKSFAGQNLPVVDSVLDDFAAGIDRVQEIAASSTSTPGPGQS